MGRKKKKKPQEGKTKTMKDLTKNFEEFMKNKRTRKTTRKAENKNTKEDFDSLLSEAIKPEKS
jgi:hypothetical protein